MAIFIEAYKKDEISKKDYKRFEEKIAEKTGLNPASVYRFKADDIK